MTARRKPCPHCGRITLDDASMVGLLPALTRYENRRMSLSKLQECLNDAVRGVDVHEALLTSAQKALRVVKSEGGLTTTEIAERVGASSNAVWLALYRQRERGVVRSEGRTNKQVRWWWRTK